MFGFLKAKTQAEIDREAAIERAKIAIRDLVRSMDNATPAEAERTGKLIRDRVNAEKTLPVEFKRKALIRAKELECFANMRKCDALLHEASQFATREMMTEKGAKLTAARESFGKACALGADSEWRKAVQRMIETVMLTGGVHKKGPTRAKPADIAPQVPNRAKVS